jgi:hypothetical protein
MEEAKQGFGNAGLLKGWLFIVRVVVPIVLAVVIYQVGKQAVEMVAGLL